jgi:hypothetical protein
VAVLLGTAAIQPASGAAVKWLTVSLGTHRFGQLRAPDAVVARTGPAGVGFECGKPSACSAPGSSSGGCGCIDVLPQGPSSFDVARDGSIWVLDVVKNRFLVWRPGRPAPPARSVPLPKNLGIGDFTLGRNGTLYLTATDPGAGHKQLWALTPTGRVRWKTPIATDGNSALRTAPKGAVYAAGPVWTPLTTPGGRPLSVPAQRDASTRFQPLGRGLRLVATDRSSHEARFRLVDRAGRTIHAWRITSLTQIGFAWRALTPTLVGSDLVVALDVFRRSTGEHVVLRLSPTGATTRRIALDAGAAWDPDGTTVKTPLRIGPDGSLYQLRTDPKTGVTIARYSLGSSR